MARPSRETGFLCSVGDCAIVSSFTSYLGPFNKEFRQLLMDRDLRSACARLNIPVTPDLNVANFLVDDAEVAEWTAQVRLAEMHRFIRMANHTKIMCT